MLSVVRCLTECRYTILYEILFFTGIKSGYNRQFLMRLFMCVNGLWKTNCVHYSSVCNFFSHKLPMGKYRYLKTHWLIIHNWRISEEEKNVGFLNEWKNWFMLKFALLLEYNVDLCEFQKLAFSCLSCYSFRHWKHFLTPINHLTSLQTPLYLLCVCACMRVCVCIC